MFWNEFYAWDIINQTNLLNQEGKVKLFLEEKKKEGGEEGLKLHSTETSNCKVESHFCGGQKSALFETYDGRKGTRTAIDGHWMTAS